MAEVVKNGVVSGNNGEGGQTCLNLDFIGETSTDSIVPSNNLVENVTQSLEISKDKLLTPAELDPSAIQEAMEGGILNMAYVDDLEDAAGATSTRVSSSRDPGNLHDNGDAANDDNDGEDEDGDDEDDEEDNEEDGEFISSLMSMGGSFAKAMKNSNEFFVQFGAVAALFCSLLNTGHNLAMDYKDGNLISAFLNTGLVFLIQVPTLFVLLFMFLKDKVIRTIRKCCRRRKGNHSDTETLCHDDISDTSDKESRKSDDVNQTKSSTASDKSTGLKCDNVILDMGLQMINPFHEKEGKEEKGDNRINITRKKTSPKRKKEVKKDKSQEDEEFDDNGLNKTASVLALTSFLQSKRILKNLQGLGKKKLESKIKAKTGNKVFQKAKTDPDDVTAKSQDPPNGDIGTNYDSSSDTNKQNNYTTVDME